MIAVIVEDFRAGTARTGVAHRPEIVAGRDADDPVVGQAGDLLPQAEAPRRPYGRPSPADAWRRCPKSLVISVPGKLDRPLLEIVAEGEIAEHFKESMVPRGEPDIVQVIVLATGAHAFLRGRGRGIGAFFNAGKHVLELHHARIGEHQRRVVARHQRAGRDFLMTVLGKEVEEGRTDFIHAAHIAPLSLASDRPQPA